MSQPAVKVDGRVARRTGTRELILDAATELFAARGVTSTSIDDIAERAGIAKGSIYYNFVSKSGLVEAVFARSGERFSRALAQAAEARSGDALRAEVVRTLLRLLQEYPDSARVMVTEMFRTERTWRESIQAWRQLALSPLADDLVAHGIGAADARTRAAAVVGATLVAGLEWLVFHPERGLEEVTGSVLVAFD